MIKTKIIITIGDEDVELEEAEARRILAELGNLFGWINPRVPYRGPVYPLDPVYPDNIRVTWASDTKEQG